MVNPRLQDGKTTIFFCEIGVENGKLETFNFHLLELFSSFWDQACKKKKQ